MNPKIRALIWEELRTGGVIAAWCTMVGGLCLLSARLIDDWGIDWNYSSPVALSLSVLPLLLLALLLLYRTGNSGILTGGFSGRILLLPVETWKLAGLALFHRAALLGAATLLTIALCRALYGGNGPAWVLVVLLPAFFMLLQALDWLRRPNPLLALLGLIPVGLSVTSLLRSESFTRGGLDTPFISGTAGLGTLILAGGIAFVFALFAVNRSRRGARLRVALRVALPEAMPIPGWRAEGGFRSPRWALLWHFLSKDGFMLPFYFVVFGAFVAMAFVGWRRVDDEHAVPLLVVLDWGVWPVFALAAMIWGGLRGGAGIQRGIRPVLTQYLYPVSAAEMAVTRLWGYGLVLGGTWALAFILSNLGFFLGEHALAWRIWRDAIASNETSLRELLTSRLVLPAIVLIGAWVLTAIRTRLVAWMLGLMVLYATTIAIVQTWYHDDDPEWIIYFPFTLTVAGTITLIVWTLRGYRRSPLIGACWVLPYALAIYLGATTDELDNNLPWLPAAFIVAITFAALLWSWQRGIMPLRHLAGCAVAWGATMLFAFPFGAWELSGIDRQSFFLVTMLGALVVLPYPALLLDLHRRRHHDDTPVAPEDHAHPRGWGLSPALRTTAHVGLVIAVLMAAWLRWPAKPVYIETFRAQGKPATASDLANLYHALPPEENAAHDYIQVLRENQHRSNQWYGLLEEKHKSSDEQSRLLYGKQNPIADETIDLRPDQPLWAPFWDVARQYHEEVSGPMSSALMSVAAKQPRQSRYAIDLGSGAAVSLNHLAAIRRLARIQSYEVWMAAMEDRPADALATIKAIGPVAESLREEPILISQLVRIAVHGIMTSAVEQALNRTEFTDAQLGELQDYLSKVLPPISEHSMIAQGLIGERIFASIQPDMEGLQDYGMNMFATLLPHYLFAMDRTITLRAYAEMSKNLENRPTPLLHEIEESMNPQFVLPKIMLPSLDRAREAEYRCRMTLDMAVTACAVERYRLANGALPATLDALVPAFLKTVPADPFRDDGGSISYRVTEDGGYALYSWAQNRKDDCGIHRDPKEKKGNDWGNGDWIFSVAPLSFRNGPQLTDVPPVDEESTTNPAAGLGRRSL